MEALYRMAGYGEAEDEWVEDFSKDHQEVEVGGSGRWWWNPLVSCYMEQVDPLENAEAHVRSYWGDAVHDEVTEAALEPSSVDRERARRRRRRSDEPTSASLFATDELDEEELAELGKLLLRTGDSVEERARLTQAYLARRRETPEAARPKPGTAAWRARLEAMRNDIFKDKKQLSTRQVKRASFLDNAKGADDGLASAKTRERLSRHRLQTLQSRRASKEDASVTTSSRWRRVLGAKKTPPPRDDEETVEHRAAVDLFWKGRDDAI